MVAYNRGYKCENIEIIPMIREALFHRLTLGGDKAKMRLAGDVPDYTGKAGN